jgi:archaellum component FlaC
MEIDIRTALVAGGALVQTGGLIVWVKMSLKANAADVKKILDSKFQTVDECIQIRKEWKSDIEKDFGSGRREFDEVKAQLRDILNILLEIKKQ